LTPWGRDVRRSDRPAKFASQLGIGNRSTSNASIGWLFWDEEAEVELEKIEDAVSAAGQTLDPVADSDAIELGSSSLLDRYSLVL